MAQSSIQTQLNQARRGVLRRDTLRKAVLGNGSGQVDVPGDNLGRHWARFILGSDDNGFPLYGPVMTVLASGALYLADEGRQVWLKMRNGLWVIEDADSDDLRNAGIDARALRPNDRYNKFRYLDEIVNLNAYKVEGLIVAVREWIYHTANNTIKIWQGTDAGTHVELTSYVPAVVDTKCYALLVFNVSEHILGNDPLEIISSTPISLFSDLGESDLQECYDAFPVDDIIIPIRAFTLEYGQTEIGGPDTDVDLRQFINIPAVGVMLSFIVSGDSGTPQTIEDGNTLQILGGTGLSSVASTTDTLTLNLDNTAVSAGAYTYAGFTVDAQGRLIAASSGTAPVTSVGGTAPIASSGGTTPVISHNTSGVVAATYAYPTTLDVNATGHITSITAGTAPVNPPFVDTQTIIKGSADATKLLRFEVDGFTTATTRVLTAPNYDGTIATIAGAEAFSNKAITSSTLDSSPIGSTTASTGKFTSLEVTTAHLIMPSLGGGAGSVQYKNGATVNNEFYHDGSNYLMFNNTGQMQFRNTANAEVNFFTNGVARIRIAASGLISLANTSVSAATQVDISNTSALTNTILTLVTTRHNTSGTPAANYGSAHLNTLQSSASPSREASIQDTYWVTATDASRASRLDVSAYYTSTKQVGLSIQGDTGGVKTSVNGVAPVAPPTYGVPVGTPTRTTFDTTTVTLQQLAERVYAIIIDQQAFGPFK